MGAGRDGRREGDPQIVRCGVLVEPSLRYVGSEKRRESTAVRDGSLDLDEEKRSRHPRAHRFEFENSPSGAAGSAPLELLAQPDPWNFWLSRTLRALRESRAVRSRRGEAIPPSHSPLFRGIELLVSQNSHLSRIQFIFDV